MCSVKWVFSDSDCEFVEPQTLLLTRKREASVALESETERTIGSRKRKLPPRTARERVLIAKMEQYLEKRDSIHVEISELEHFFPGPEDSDISIRLFGANAREEGGYGKFVLLDAPRGKGAGRAVEVADAARCAEVAEKGRRREGPSAARRRATREREETAMKLDPAQLLPVFDAVCARTPRDRLIIRMNDHVVGYRTSSLSWRRWRSIYEVRWILKVFSVC